ncbi:MAG TPA: TonB-dependent receptor [Flavobacterium sp.]|nr:TonB-dependent receptor [Flavobacterium sp.]
MKRPFFYAVGLCILSTTTALAQTDESLKTQQDSLSNASTEETLDELIIQSIRAKDNTPMTFSKITKKDLESRNLGQDIPALLNFMPSVVSTSDAGNGVGYSGIRVRGSDATRINVTINGIPYNDAESHGTFWVNMPDFVSSVENMQLQRGVGASTNGAGAFGGSLNMLTDGYAYNAGGEIANSFGSFNTRKHTVKFTTGLIDNRFELTGRLSDMRSDGYIDRASSRLQSYFLQGTYVEGNTLIKLLTFGGNEKTYQAWNGVEDSDIEKYGRRFNTSGMYFDADGNMRFYDNETDNYKQNHYQLHWHQKWSDNWQSSLAFHYTDGLGYYENYKAGEDITEYGFEPIMVNGELIEESDIIRRKYLENDFYGLTFSVNYNKDNFDLMIGGAANQYKGDHYGDILWTSEPLDYQYKQYYYFDNSTKNDANVFAKATYTIDDSWILYGDLQLRNVTYEANGQDTGLVDDKFNFFNPKAGVTYLLNDENNFYLSYARANREPNRNDYENGNPKPETLDDFELGWKLNKTNFQLNINGYYMHYTNQLVLTGALNDVGAAVRENSGKSYRAGIEIDAKYRFHEKWLWQPNLTFSQNKNVDYRAEFDGEIRHFGNTSISFSPDIIAGNAITFLPIDDLSLTLLTKYVGEQYMGNTDREKSKLKAYTTTDFVASYRLPLKKWFKEARIDLMVNNIFDTEYISNGFYYTFDDDWSNPGQIATQEGAGYYPQAMMNFLVGLTLKF